MNYPNFLEFLGIYTHGLHISISSQSEFETEGFVTLPQPRAVLQERREWQSLTDIIRYGWARLGWAGLTGLRIYWPQREILTDMQTAGTEEQGRAWQRPAMIVIFCILYESDLRCIPGWIKQILPSQISMVIMSGQVCGAQLGWIGVKLGSGARAHFLCSGQTRAKELELWSGLGCRLHSEARL